MTASSGVAGAMFGIDDPATGERIATIGDTGPDDALVALTAADHAAQDWQHLPARRRADLLHRAATLLVERADEFVELMASEAGKPLADGRAEVAYAASYLRWYAEEAPRVSGRVAENEDDGTLMLVTREPVGVCLAITPWNFPLAMVARKVAPALAAGCTCVVKPAEQTPLCALALADVLREAGVPDGVVNVIPTTDPAGVTQALLGDARLRKLSFTGSTTVGRVLLAQAAPGVQRVSMELGGNAPLLVFADCDLAVAVDGALTAKMRNGGQACTAANRVFVDARIAEDFVEAFAARVAALRVGPPRDPATDVGPLIDEAQCHRVEALVRDAVRAGAQVRCGGARLRGPGTFFAPTVLTDVPAGAAICREEIFGPVAPVFTFTSEQDAVAMANDTSMGLAAYVFTGDLNRARRVAGGLRTGMVGVNRGVVSTAGAPFGGVNQSGLGREGGPEGLEAYLETKYVALGPSV